MNHVVVVSCGKKNFNAHTSEIAAECLKLCGVSDAADAVATCKDRYVKRCVLNSSLFCEMCAIYGRLCNRAGRIYFHPVVSSSSFFRLFSSPNLSGRRLDVYHTFTNGVVCKFRMQV